jgi:hypothetical protein
LKSEVGLRTAQLFFDQKKKNLTLSAAKISGAWCRYRYAEANVTAESDTILEDD